MRYWLIEATSPGKLSDRVTQWLKEGWGLWGSPFIDKDDIYYQAVVLYDEDREAKTAEAQGAERVVEEYNPHAD